PVARRLVDLHGGTITAHSEGPGRGSEFVVRLPLAQAEAESQPAGRPSQAAGPNPKRILVVDDNVDAAESLALLLQLWGHEVHVAHNGPDALRAVEGHRPDVVVLGIGMPGVNGYEVAQQIRQQDQGRNVMLVAVTGYGQETDRRRSTDAGFNHHLTKPVTPQALQTLFTH